MANLHGQIALVTGGGSGLGAATARALADSGADVAIVGLTEEKLATVADDIARRGRRGTYAVADIARSDEIREAVAHVRATLGPITLLINSAAISTPIGRVAELDPEEWTHSLAVNLNGPFYAIRAVVPEMLEQGYGRILTVSSGAAVTPEVGLVAYSTAKAGVNHLTSGLQAELAGTNVIAIGLSPGVMDTPMQAHLRSLPVAETDRFRDFQAKGWLRPAEEAAAVLCWLCGPDGAEYAGQCVSLASSAIRQRVGLPDLPEEVRKP
jgi:NAD(P)-dependent dehydrogenase (short-subunit alcohol dehydrogenase family)